MRGGVGFWALPDGWLRFGGDFYLPQAASRLPWRANEGPKAGHTAPLGRAGCGALSVLDAAPKTLVRGPARARSRPRPAGQTPTFRWAPGTPDGNPRRELMVQCVISLGRHRYGGRGAPAGLLEALAADFPSVSEVAGPTSAVSPPDGEASAQCFEVCVTPSLGRRPLRSG